MKTLILFYAIIGPMGHLTPAYSERIEVPTCETSVHVGPIENMPDGWYEIDIARCEG